MHEQEKGRATTLDYHAPATRAGFRPPLRAWALAFVALSVTAAFGLVMTRTDRWHDLILLPIAMLLIVFDIGTCAVSVGHALGAPRFCRTAWLLVLTGALPLVLAGVAFYSQWVMPWLRDD